MLKSHFQTTHPNSKLPEEAITYIRWNSLQILRHVFLFQIIGPKSDA